MLGISRRRRVAERLARIGKQSRELDPRGTVAVSIGGALSDQPYVEKPCGASLFWHVALALAEVSNRIVPRNTWKAASRIICAVILYLARCSHWLVCSNRKEACWHREQVFSRGACKDDEKSPF